ncbi:hypothetical protein [Sphingomonas sp. MMS24-J13]|uniref:hypothetical protein n=1 Tax=Sphingomonas sp. MMS24-J13 TaxID=3238686 RepID=UPI00384BB16A
MICSAAGPGGGGDPSYTGVNASTTIPSNIAAPGTGFTKTNPHHAQIVVNLVGLVNCCGIKFAYDDGATTYGSLGHVDAIAAAPMLTEVHRRIIPGSIDFNAVGASSPLNCALSVAIAAGGG